MEIPFHVLNEHLRRNLHDDCIVSNFDGCINESVEKELKNCYRLQAPYPAWNFYAYVWWSIIGEEFIALVFRYHEPVMVCYDNTVTGIIEQVSEEYGYE